MTTNGISNRIILALLLTIAVLTARAESEDSEAEYLAEARAAIEAQGRQALLELESEMRRLGKPVLAPLIRPEAVVRAPDDRESESNEERG